MTLITDALRTGQETTSASVAALLRMRLWVVVDCAIVMKLTTGTKPASPSTHASRGTMKSRRLRMTGRHPPRLWLSIRDNRRFGVRGHCIQVVDDITTREVLTVSDCTMFTWR